VLVVVYLDNAAGRLHQVLAPLTAMSGDVPLPRAWAVALESEHDRGTEFQHKILAVVGLADRARHDLIECLENDEHNEPLLRWVEPVLQIQAIAFQMTKVSAVQQHLPKDVLLSLEMAARELHRYRPDGQVDEDTATKARDAIAEVLQALREDTALDAETRASLLRHAAALQHALALAWLTGPEAVNDALTGLVGGLAMATLKSTDAATKPAVLSKVAGVIEVVANVLTIAQGTATMIAVAPQVAGLLGAG
jgi:hypothetical protein